MPDFFDPTAAPSGEVEHVTEPSYERQRRESIREHVLANREREGFDIERARAEIAEKGHWTGVPCAADAASLDALWRAYNEGDSLPFQFDTAAAAQLAKAAQTGAIRCQAEGFAGGPTEAPAPQSTIKDGTPR